MEEKGSTFGTIREGKVFLNAWDIHTEREIGEVKDDNPEASFQYFEEKFKELESKVSELENIIDESVNKGSFLMKLLHLKELLAKHDGLGDYQALKNRLVKQEELLADIISQNRSRNADIKKVLIEEAKVTVDKINWKQATIEIHDIKTRWIKTGNAPDDIEPELEETFWSVVSGFFDKKKAFYEDKKRLGEKNRSEYLNLVAEANKLSGVHGKERFQKVKDLKQRWSELGNIPKEEYGPLIDQFNKHLKPTQQESRQDFDIKPIVAVLDNYLSGKEPADMKKLEDYRNTLKSYKPTSFSAKQERREVFGKIQLLKEKDFLVNLVRRRFKNYKEMEKSERIAMQIKVLADLISRDKEDLAKYVENAENFSTSSGQINPMVEKQLNQQKTKVAVKEQLLEMLKDS